MGLVKKKDFYSGGVNIIFQGRGSMESRERTLGISSFANFAAKINSGSVKVIFMLMIFCIFSGITAGSSYYVDPDVGNDGSAGTSVSPWKTISKAKTTATAGDTVILCGGNYGAVSFDYGDNRGTS